MYVFEQKVRKGYGLMNHTKYHKAIDAIFYKIVNQKSKEWNLDINRWDWSCGVGIYGIIKAYEMTGDEKYKKFIKNWFERNGSERKFGSVNNVVPANAVLFLAKETRDEKYQKVCKEYADWCMNTALRTCNGGWAHVWWQGGKEDYKHQLWIDSVFMAGIFLLKYGASMQDSSIVEEAIKQFELHMDSLFDPGNNLFYHAYHCIEKVQLGEHWGRGNGWMVASLVELLDILADSNYKLDKYKNVFRKVMEKAYEVKTEDGMLRTLPAVEESYKETTATSLFGYAALKGYRLGVLDKKFYRWGMQAGETICGYVSEEGNILHCSYGTDPEEREVYLTRPCDQSLYADGIVMMFLSQVMGVPR